MRLRFATFLMIILFSSCLKQNDFPEKISNKFLFEELTFPSDLKDNQNEKSSGKIDFSNLEFFVTLFELKNEEFSLPEFVNEWNTFSADNDKLGWSDSDLKTWVDITGLLLELTNDTKYAEELESIVTIASKGLRQTIAPYFLTKRMDHIYVHLFQSIEINYNHSLGGKVKFRQESDYSKSGKVKLYFGMSERRYIELFIRIPDWAQGSTVTVKQVKYFAAPGTYCKIAKKWNEGDVVEIEFPIGQLAKNN